MIFFLKANYSKLDNILRISKVMLGQEPESGSPCSRLQPLDQVG